jgi:single-strand DNA-binding protein
MANYNKVILVGNLTRDPQLSYLPSQTPVCEFGMAINRRWRGANGEPREETCFIDCRCYGKQAETFNQYMSKGQPVLVEGRLQLDTWEDKEGQKRSKHRVAVDRFQFLSAPGARREGAAPRQQQRPAPQAPAPPAADEEPARPPPPEDQPSAEDIPF